MGEKKPKVCKCGHSRDLHIRNKKLRIFPGSCESCPCTTYLKRERPDKVDFILMLNGLFLTAAFIFMGIFSAIYWDSLQISEQDAKIIMPMMFIILAVGVYFNNIVIPYFSARKRKTYPEAV